MPEYTLRNLDPRLWSRFTERAARDGWPTKALLVSLMEEYASGSIDLPVPPPKPLPEFGWLRGYYKAVAGQADFASVPHDEQWKRLYEHVLDSPAGGSGRALAAMPPDQRRELLDWLRRTSAVTVRHVLTLRANGHIIVNGPNGETREPWEYHVLGLPAGHQISINNYDGGWRVLWIFKGNSIKTWSGQYPTPAEALDDIARELESAQTA